MEEGDEWLSPDKYQHFLACFLITLIVSFLARRTRNPFLLRRSAAIGTLASLATGADKEAGDEFGLWMSNGGSVKDFAADLLGIVVAYLFLARFPYSSTRKSGSDPDPDPMVSMV